MGTSDSRSQKLNAAGRLVAVALIYAGVARLGMMLSNDNSGLGLMPVVRPSTGLALAALLIGGYQLWPSIAVGALMVSLFRHMPPLVACGIAAARTLEALAGVLALRRVLRLRSPLDRFQDVVSLAVFAGLMAPALGATLGVATLALGGVVARELVVRTWLTWWAGDLVGGLVVAPALLAWVAVPLAKPRAAQLVEPAAIGLVLSTCSTLVFARGPSDLPSYPILHTYLLFLPLIWAALRFGIRGATTGMLLVTFVAVWGTSRGRGDFAREGAADSLLAMHVFLAATSITTLALGAVVSEREQSRRRLNDSESLLRSILDGTSDSIYAKDPSGRYVLMNAAGARLLGLPAEEITGKDDSALFAAEEAQALVAVDNEVMRTRCSRETDEHLVLRGESRVYHTTRTPYLDHHGSVVGVIGISRDITARRQVEKEIAELHEKARVESELRRLDERQRREVAALLVRERAARDEAEAATNAKDEFLAVLSHELRTPLQSMLGWTQMLRTKRLDGLAAEKGLETIERNVRTQAHLIEDLLDISRIVAGTIRVDRRPLDLRPIVAEALASAASAAAARSIQLDAALDPRPAPVSGDRDRLAQVVSNLLGNAVKFTPHGGRVILRLELQLEARSARIVVEDSGRGISPEFLPHVFDRFRQAESTTRRSHGGLGIGLSIVRHLVELHGGTVTAESPGEGQGATFTVTLPLTTEAQATSPQAKATPGATTLVGARVVDDDDDPDTCELLQDRRIVLVGAAARPS